MAQASPRVRRLPSPALGARRHRLVDLLVPATLVGVAVALGAWSSPTPSGATPPASVCTPATPPSTTTTTAPSSTTTTTTTTTSTTTTTVPAEPVFVFDGGGWGHGVGMSQYGALGRADAGWTHVEILTFYYDGTEVVTDPAPFAEGGLVPDTVDVRVDTTSSVEIDPCGIVSVGVDGTPLATTDRPVRATRAGGTWDLRLVAPDGSETPLCSGGCPGTEATVTMVDGEPVVVSSNGRAYAHGRIRLVPRDAGVIGCGTAGGSFCVIVGDMTMQQYLYGLAEVPASWPTEALRAQAVAGRSYATVKVLERTGQYPFDLYDSVQDQNYEGWSHEQDDMAFTGGAWRAAVDATDREVVVYRDAVTGTPEVITAFYSSSNGGYVAASEESFVTALPYLKAKPDPYDAAYDTSGRPRNPNFSWSYAYTLADLSRWFADYPYADLDVGDLHQILITDRGPSGRLDDALVTLVGSRCTIEVRRGTARYDSAGCPTYSGTPYGYRFYYAVRLGCLNDPGCDGAIKTTNFVVITFLDVPRDTWFTEPVDWLVRTGITTGVAPNAFAPDQNVTRAELATFLWRFAGEPAASAPIPFTDVPAGTFYTDAVAWMVGEGITTGRTPELFVPDAPVTRAEAATFLWRLAGEPAPTATPAFTDVAAGRFYTDPVAWLVGHELTTGKTPELFAPDDPLTRAEAATFLWRLAGRPDAFAPDVPPPPHLRVVPSP